MSYLSRLYNHRNAQSGEGKDKPFFPKKASGSEKQKKNNFFQAKLSVNQPGDKYEHEADNVAKAVVNNKTAKPVVQQKEISSVQRLATSLEDEKLGTKDRRMERDKEDKVKAVQHSASPEKEKDKTVQKMEAPKKEEDKHAVQKMELPDKKKEEEMPPVQKMELPDKKKEMEMPVQKMGVDHEKEKLQKKDDHMKEEEKKKGSAVQTKHDGSANTASPQVAANLKDTSGKGNKLPVKTMREMNASFGADFSNVRVHNDSDAVNLNRELQAQAFTHGRDIYFNEGKFDSDSTQGKFLLAHELTHVIQQSGNNIQPTEKYGNMPANNRPTSLAASAATAHSETGNQVQRVHIENGRKKFDCPDFAGDARLEACLNDEDRIQPLETGPTVVKIQEAMQKDGSDLGEDGTSGTYGAATGQAVMAFKQKHNLGSTQFPDVGPGTTKKLDELCEKKKPDPKPTPKPKPKKEPAPTPDADAACQPFSDRTFAEIKKAALSLTVPSLTEADTLCGEVKSVWQTYFAATSTPFAFSDPSSCVVNDAKKDQHASSEADNIAKGHLEDIVNNLPNTLSGVTPSPFPFPGQPLAERRMELQEAIAPKLQKFLHHPSLFYNDENNAAANIAGGVGINGEGSDIFGDDDRLVGGPVVIEVDAIDPLTGNMTGKVRWKPHIHVKDTADFCPGNVTDSIILRAFTVPMSRLEAMGLTRDVPFTIDYDLKLQQSNFSVLPAVVPPSVNP